MSMARQEHRVNVHHTVKTGPEVVLLRFLLRTTFVAFLNKVVNLFLKCKVTDLINVLLRVPMFLAPAVVVLSASMSVKAKLLFKVVPTLDTSEVSPVGTVCRWTGGRPDRSGHLTTCFFLWFHFCCHYARVTNSFVKDVNVKARLVKRTSFCHMDRRFLIQMHFSMIQLISSNGIMVGHMSILLRLVRRRLPISKITSTMNLLRLICRISITSFFQNRFSMQKYRNFFSHYFMGYMGYFMTCFYTFLHRQFTIRISARMLFQDRLRRVRTRSQIESYLKVFFRGNAYFQFLSFRMIRLGANISFSSTLVLLNGYASFNRMNVSVLESRQAIFIQGQVYRQWKDIFHRYRKLRTNLSNGLRVVFRYVK